MNMQIDKNKLMKAMHDFFVATGVNISIRDEKGSCIVEKHKLYNNYCKLIHSDKFTKNKCLHSDISLIEKCKISGKVESHLCHAGLVDIVVPIVYNSTVIYYLVLGQIKTEQYFDKIKDKLSEFPFDIEKMRELYNTLPCYDETKIECITNIAIIISRHLLIENILKLVHNENIEITTAYINENLEKKLSIQDICKHTNISKNALYKAFHTFFNCTVSEYISYQRVQKSIPMLLNSDMSIENIALSMGFSSTAYYGKMFKKYYGTPPLKYRNENKL